MKSLLVTGTTREGSSTHSVAREAYKSFRNVGSAELFDLHDKNVPSMTQRLSNDSSPPEDVVEFKELVEWSDSIILVTPEYNHSIPGPLKNLLDYLYEEYHGKVFSYITVSAGGFGGIRCQSHLHDITLALKGRPGPSLPVSNVKDHFTEDSVSDEYRDKLTNFAKKVEQFSE